MTQSNPILIFGDSISGNCHKVKFTCDWLNLPYEWREVAILQGGSRTPEFLALNPFGQVPVIQLPDGRCLAQSNAIMLFLAENSPLIPNSRFARAKLFEWLFWEQYSHEPALAVLRFQRFYLKKSDQEIDPTLISKSHRALALMNDQLKGRKFLLGEDQLTLADIALVAYTRLYADAGLSMDEYKNVRKWIDACEDALGLRAKDR